jgi:hypothetical protein
MKTVGSLGLRSAFVGTLVWGGASGVEFAGVCAAAMQEGRQDKKKIAVKRETMRLERDIFKSVSPAKRRAPEVASCSSPLAKKEQLAGVFRSVVEGD